VTTTPPVRPEAWDRVATLTSVPDPVAELEVGVTVAPTHGDDEPPRKSAATMLVDLAQARYRLGLSDDDDVFAVPVNGPQVLRLLRGGRGSLRAELASAYFTATGRAAPQQALADALLVLDGKARELEPEPLALRVAEDAGDLYLDMGDATGRALRVTSSGWTITDRPPVWFRRSALTGALPVPVSGDGLTDLWNLLNVAEADRPLVLAWLIAALHPSIPHAIVALVGEQGVGKTTAARILAGILDPSPAQVRKAPRDVEGWVVAATGSWIAAIDNISAIAPWWSDALCRAVTGDGDVRRRLYSDSDLSVFAFRRAVILTGIDLGALRGDLAERLVRVELDLITPSDRRTDRDMADTWEQAHPRILGAILDLAVEVIREADHLHLDGLPRMADFARLLAAVDHVMGTQGFDRYMGQADSLAGDVVASEPVVAAILSTINTEWTGSAADLLPLITPEGRPPRDWPTNPRSLTAILRRNAPALRRLGWQVTSAEDSHTKVLRWRLAPPTYGEAGDSTPAIPATPANPTPLRASAGVAGMDSAPSQDDNPCPHGMPGGHLPDAFIDGALACPQCRKAGAA
jgi:energy-coupling factor transporter ATP-binding protein EcfA2